MQEHFYFTTKKLRKKKNKKKNKQKKKETKKTPDAFELVGLFTLNR